MSDKRKFLAMDALRVAEELIAQLAPSCTHICFAGSLRRQKFEVGDIEIVFVPRYESVPDPSQLFSEQMLVNNADVAIAALEKAGTLERRKNINGSEAFGEKIKLMRHVATGIPIDLFSTQEKSWYNYLVCRTGPAELNVRICEAALKKGWQWKPYSAGFYRIGHTEVMHSEREVFGFVGLPYCEPKDRL